MLYVAIAVCVIYLAVVTDNKTTNATLNGTETFGSIDFNQGADMNKMAAVYFKVFKIII